MAALAAPDQSQGDQGHQEGCKPPTVLQTYPVPLAAVKQNLEDWVGPIKAEYHQLVAESRDSSRAGEKCRAIGTWS